MLRGGGPERGPLTPDELLRLEAKVRAFLASGASSGGGGGGDEEGTGEGSEAAAALTAGGDLVAIRACELGAASRLGAPVPAGLCFSQRASCAWRAAARLLTAPIAAAHPRRLCHPEAHRPAAARARRGPSHRAARRRAAAAGPICRAAGHWGRGGGREPEDTGQEARPAGAAAGPGGGNPAGHAAPRRCGRRRGGGGGGAGAGRGSGRRRASGQLRGRRSGGCP
jgi:hypothetical protein